MSTDEHKEPQWSNIEENSPRQNNPPLADVPKGIITLPTSPYASSRTTHLHIITFVNKTHNLEKAIGKWLTDVLNWWNAEYVHKGAHVMFVFCLSSARCSLRAEGCHLVWDENGILGFICKVTFRLSLPTLEHRTVILNLSFHFVIFFPNDSPENVSLYWQVLWIYLIETDRNPLRNVFFKKSPLPPFWFPFSFSDVLPRQFQICSGEHLVATHTCSSQTKSFGL